MKEQLTIHPVVVHYKENDACTICCGVWGEETQCANCLFLPADTGPKIRDDLQTLQHIYRYMVAVFWGGAWQGTMWWYRRQHEAHVRRLRGHSILTAAHYARYGNACGTVEYLVVTKDDIGETRLALDAMTTSTTVKGTMTSCSGVPPAWGIDDAYDILLRVMLVPLRPICSWMPGLDKTCCSPNLRLFLLPS